MASAQRLQMDYTRPASLDCAIPLDSQYFDDGQVVSVPGLGVSETVARIELPAQYCGVLERFAQFTDLQSSHPEEISTPGIIWQILANRQPVFPYHSFSLLLNPWGVNCFPVCIRLPAASTIEMVVTRRELNTATKKIKYVGGRLLGRFWYSSAYGESGSGG